MLKGVLFFLRQETEKSPEVKTLINRLEKEEIKHFFCPAHTFSSETATQKSFAEIPSSLSLSPEECMILTDSVAGIASALTTGIPCISLIPPESNEDLSGAYALFEDFASIDAAYLCRTHAHALGYPATIFSTERLVIREFSREDFPALYAMCTKPSAVSNMEEPLSDYDTEYEKHCAYLRNIYPFFDLALWGVYEKSSGKLMGRAGFSLPEDDSHTFSIGYLIDLPYRRCGFAKELVPALLSYAEKQGYSEISARIKTTNTISVKVLAQCGYPYESTEDPEKNRLTYLIHLNT